MNKLSKKDKILLTLYKMSEGKKKPLYFEDVIVATFSAYPKDFSLPRYIEYPDSDIFRRELYFNLKPKGLIKIAQRKCMLTNLGIETAKKFLDHKIEKIIQDDNLRKEINRILQLKGFQLYIDNKYDEIIDQDLYEFLRISVRTKTLEIAANLSLIKDIIERFSKINKVGSIDISKYLEFLIKKFPNYVGELK